MRAPAASQRGELLRVEGANQPGEVRSESPDFDLRVCRPIAPREIEEQRDADVVDVLES